jgi:hypothetical protein
MLISLDQPAVRGKTLHKYKCCFGVARLGKSLLPNEVRVACQVEPWNFLAWANTLVEALHEFKLRKGNVAGKLRNRISNAEDNRKANGYSRMNYEQLRKIADNDLIAENVSNEEYEALSVAMWRKFSVENGLK